jgi:glycosyltransferase involved in cell wall biosynthesis
VLIGNIDEQRKQDVESRHANIRFLGLKLQMQLPAYLHFASVCVIPFKNDNITKYVNPLKVYEYLAMGKPVVSAGLVEVASIPGVVSVADAAHFSAAVREALTAPMDTKSVCAFVEANSWTARVRQFCACLESSPPPSRRTT